MLLSVCFERSCLSYNREYQRDYYFEMDDEERTKRYHQNIKSSGKTFLRKYADEASDADLEEFILLSLAQVKKRTGESFKEEIRRLINKLFIQLRDD